MAHHAGADVGFHSISEYEINSIPPPGRDVVHRSLSSSIDFGGTVEPRFTVALRPKSKNH